MNYKNYIIHRSKKYLRVFLEFSFNVGCTSNMPGAPSNTQKVIPKGPLGKGKPKNNSLCNKAQHNKTWARQMEILLMTCV